MASPPNPVGRAVVIIAVTFTFIDLVFIALRLWARRLKIVKLDASDYLIVAAWLLALADMVRKVVAAGWGVGVHFDELVAAIGFSTLTRINKITFSGFFLWLAIVSLTKLSILFLYRTLFRCMTRFIVVVHIMMSIVALYWIGFTLGSIFQCKPVAFNWDKTIPGGTCLNPKSGFLTSGSVNLVLDVILVVMPAPVVWKMQHVSQLKKIGITTMFSLGLIVCFLAGFRFKFVLATDIADFNHDGEVAGIPGELELYLGIIGACLPLISPPLLAISQKVQSGYSSFVGRRRPGYAESSSDVVTFPKDEDSVVEVGPLKRSNVAEIDEHTIQCHSEWIVKSETRSDV
ncbi:hypothetical protein ACN47E_001550 [Coniothyrium glycines]